MSSFTGSDRAKAECRPESLGSPLATEGNWFMAAVESTTTLIQNPRAGGQDRADGDVGAATHFKVTHA